MNAANRGLVCLLFIFLALERTSAQRVTIQMLNGKSGKPITKGRFIILFPGDKRPELVLPTNGAGEVEFDAQGANTIEVSPQLFVSCAQKTGGPRPLFS